MKRTIILTILAIVALTTQMVSAQCPGSHCTTGLYTTGCSQDDYVNNFSFAGMTNNGTGCNASPVTAAYCTGKTATVTAGMTYSISIQSGPEPEGFGVWIDYNMDDDFADAGEFAYASPSSSTVTCTGTVSIPAAAGGTTRMRVRSNYNTTVTSAQSCNQFSWGETEDYKLVINCTQAPIKPTTISGNTTVCQGSSQLYTADAMVGATTYSWTVPAGYTITSGQGTRMLSVTVGTTAGTLSVTAGNTCGISQVTTKAISVVAPLTTPAVSGPSAVCAGSSYTYSITTVPTATAYAWSLPTGFVVNSGQGTTQINVTAGVQGGNVSVTTTNACGTSAASTQSVTVSSAPPVGSGTITGPTTVCAGNAYSYSSSAVSGATIYNWAAPAGSSFVSGQGTATVSIQFGTTAGSVTVTPSNGCTGTSSTLSVTVNSSPVANAGTDASLCPGNSTQLNASGGTGYSWSPAAGLSNSNISNPVATPSATTNYTVTVSGSNGCSSKDNVTVTIHQLPVANAGSDVSFCQGGSANLSAGGGVSYQWSPSAGLSATNISDPVASPNNTTTYTVDVTSADGCTASDEVTVTVNPLPNASAGNDVSICPGGNTQFNAAGGTIYSWNPATDLSDPTIADPVATPAATTTYVVTVTDANGCSATDDIIIEVGSLPLVNAGADVSVCSGSATTLSASGTGSFSWLPASGLSCTACTDPIATVGSTTTYTVTATTACGTVSDEVTVAIAAAPSVNAGADVSICPGDSVALNAAGSGTFSWSAPIGLSCTNCANPMAGPGATTTYTVTVTASCGTGTDEVTVTVNQPVVPAITPNGTTLTSSSANAYQWIFNGTPIPSANNQSYNTLQPGVYNVCVIDVNGCTACSAGYTVTATGIQEQGLEPEMSIYPNPVEQFVQVHMGLGVSGDFNICLINIQGDIMLTESGSRPASSADIRLDVSGLPSGIYFLELRSAGGPVVRKLIKQ